MPFFLHADLLYWQAQVNALDSAVTQKGEFVQPHFNWEPGVRISLGQEVKHDSWDYSLTFTHFHTKARRSESSDNMVPFWLNPACSSGSPDALHERWRLHMGLLDLDLGKKVPVTSFLSIHPHIGIRYAMVRQKYHINFSGVALETFSTKNKFYGAGPRIGCDIFFKITPRFGIYQGLAISIIYGQFYIHESDKSKETNRRAVFYDRYMHPEPIVEVPLGLFYESKHWYVNAAYEVQLFFNQNQLISFNYDQTGNRGDLTLHGLTLGASYKF